MEPNDIEELIKTELRETEITPSDQARVRLISALNADRKNNRTPWLRYAIAASVLFCVSILGFQLLKSDSGLEEVKPITNKDEPTNVKSNNTIVTQQNIKNEEANNKTEELEPNVLGHANQDQELTYATAVDGMQMQNEIDSDTSQPILEIQNIKSKQIEVSPESTGLVMTLKPETDNLEKKESTLFFYITAKELLNAVETDTGAHLFTPSKKTPASYVNSDQLLLEMERQLFDDANKSIFKKAGRQLKKIKTAVANRNFKD